LKTLLTDKQEHNFISNVDVMNLMKINYDILATEIDNFGFLEDWRKYDKNKLKKNSGCDMFFGTVNPLIIGTEIKKEDEYV
jgi:hypothetical protein